MKTLIIFFMYLISIPVFSQENNPLSNELNSLYEKREYFTLQKVFDNNFSSLKNWQQLYYQALLDNVFNNPAESNTAIDKLLADYKDELTDSMEVILYHSKLINCVNLFSYKDASEITEVLLSQYKNHIGKDEIDELENSGLIWKSGASLSPQTVVSLGDTRLKIKKDIAGLVNVNVNVNDHDEQFIFDTGANFSTISESFAKKLGLTFLEGKLEVGTITSKKVSAGLACAKSLMIGNLKFSNVLFLVLPDEALTFGGGVYVIKGILGFPVIKEMKEIQISEHEIFVPLKINSKEKSNLALDGFIPLIETYVNQDTLIFSFDTGARRTMMYSVYYEKHKTMIDSTYKPEELSIGGAGGEVKVKGFKLDELSFQISNSKAVLEDVSLFSEKIKEKDKYVYGNLGGDFINSFGKMIINFEGMYVDFEK